MYPVRLREAIGAGATVANALTGSPLEFVEEEVMVDVYSNADIVGMNCTMSGFRGSAPGIQLLPAATPISLASTVGTMKVNEDFMTTISVPAHTRLVLSVTNPGAASNFNFLFHVR